MSFLQPLHYDINNRFNVYPVLLTFILYLQYHFLLDFCIAINSTLLNISRFFWTIVARFSVMPEIYIEEKCYYYNHLFGKVYEG